MPKFRVGIDWVIALVEPECSGRPDLVGQKGLVIEYSDTDEDCCLVRFGTDDSWWFRETELELMEFSNITIEKITNFLRGMTAENKLEIAQALITWAREEISKK